jgi:tetratricopeptide (TPR) repeat protein
MKYTLILGFIFLSSCSTGINTNKPNHELEDLGDSILAQGDLDTAIQIYRSKLISKPNSRRILLALGLALFQKSNYTEAETVLRYAFDLAPDNVNIFTQYIKILLKNNKAELTPELINTFIISTQKTTPEFFLTINTAFLVNEKIIAANKACDIALSKYPDNLPLKHHKAYILLLFNQIELASKYANEVLRQPYANKKQIRQILIIADILAGKITKAKNTALLDVSALQADKMIKSYQKMNRVRTSKRNLQLLQFIDFLLPKY